ncbi:hypothetical protein AVEN_48133-1 [Araneus ventricosus]|uniref:Uncharacterized protein n=1 Tax=Araneus ventricosus TaxID=182803 RepID=A0A4Y2WXM3_ARAVE|nr:hypothetical protein AVEN_48133-1 [Araneus ventricosus]
MSLAYAECPQDVRDSLAAQYFVDAITDEDTQYATRLMDAKDLKSALAYSMKYEAAKTVSKTSRNVRSIEKQNNQSLLNLTARSLLRKYLKEFHRKQTINSKPENIRQNSLASMGPEGTLWYRCLRSVLPYMVRFYQARFSSLFK